MVGVAADLSTNSEDPVNGQDDIDHSNENVNDTLQLATVYFLVKMKETWK